jgi:choice-of-anchor B domain-containing protein
MARSSGTSFVDITDPTAPVYLGNLPSTAGEQPWRDVKVYADHAFIVADRIPNHGMQIFDLTRLRGVTSPQTFTVDTLYSNIGSAHNVAINENSGFAYIVGSDQCAGGLHMVDVRNPEAPVFAGCFSADGYTHDVQCVNYIGPDPDHQGDEVCFASNEDSLTIIDVSNKSAPTMLGKVDYPLVGYSHQGWLDEGQRVFFLGDESDEMTYGMNTRTLMLDVSDLDNPVYGGAYQHSTSSIDHNLYIKGDYLFEANYLAGLRILHIDRAASIGLTEVAYFDTAPARDAFDFDGAWNVYPFFDNGTILVSDMSNGLFLLGASLEADPAAHAPINGSTSGLWVAEGLNDQGLTIFVGEDDHGPFFYFAWFLYLDGAPTWLVGNTYFEYGADEVTVPTLRLSGLEFLTISPDLADRVGIGSLDVHVHGCDELHVTYDFGDLGSQELELHRLAAVQGRECAE